MKRIVLIPAYMPDEKMVSTAKKLFDNGFEIIIVNDGSPEKYDSVFERTREYAQVLGHSENKGKGEALKTGLKYIRSCFDAPYIVVNADADGQHRTQDIIKAADAAEMNRSRLVLGSRRMEGRVPLRSRIGNNLTRLVYRLATKTNIYDTQTGLRAYSDKLVDRLIEIEGSRYEYEMNMLMELSAEGREIVEVWIDTVYINNNSASHFNPVKDSAKIYVNILKFSASSIFCFGIDYGLFCLLSALTGSLVLANLMARIVSGTVNFTLNKKLVFRSKSNVAAAAARYAALAVFVLICNTLVLKGLTGFGVAAYTAKIITEIIMFIFNFFVQKGFVFRKEVTAT